MIPSFDEKERRRLEGNMTDLQLIKELRRSLEIAIVSVAYELEWRRENNES